MKEVLQQAEKLAQTILDSEEFIRMHQLETNMAKDEATVNLITAVTEKRQAVETLLSSSEMDHTALAAAADELETAEEAMNQSEIIQQMRDARGAFSNMMQNVNQILRFVITGDTGEDEDAGCSGSCGSCGGCHSH